MTQLRNQTKLTLSHVCASLQSVQYCSSHLSHMDIFSGSELVQQRAQTSPSSPTTSSSSLSSCVGAVHTCASTCSHGPYGGYCTCLRIKNCCKCKSTRTYSCNSLPDPLHIPYDAPVPQACKQVLNACPTETMNIIVPLLPLGQRLSTDKWPCHTQQSVDSKIVPVSSIAPEGWGPKEGGNATSPLHSRGSPTKGDKIRSQNLRYGSP